MTMFGFAGLYFFVLGEMRRTWWAYLLAGVLLGLSFLTKLWLVAPFVLAAAAVFVLNRIRLRKTDRTDAAHVGVAALGFLTAASLHPPSCWLSV